MNAFVVLFFGSFCPVASLESACLIAKSKKLVEALVAGRSDGDACGVVVVIVSVVFSVFSVVVDVGGGGGAYILDLPGLPCPPPPLLSPPSRTAVPRGRAGRRAMMRPAPPPPRCSHRL